MFATHKKNILQLCLSMQEHIFIPVVQLIYPPLQSDLSMNTYSSVWKDVQRSCDQELIW